MEDHVFKIPQEINEEFAEGASWGREEAALWAVVLAFLSYATRRLSQESSEFSLGYRA